MALSNCGRFAFIFHLSVLANDVSKQVNTLLKDFLLLSKISRRTDLSKNHWVSSTNGMKRLHIYSKKLLRGANYSRQPNDQMLCLALKLTCRKVCKAGEGVWVLCFDPACWLAVSTAVWFLFHRATQTVIVILIELPSGSFYMFICCPFFSTYTEYIMLAQLITRFQEWQTSPFSYFLPLFAVASLQQSRMIIFSSSHTYCIMWQRGFSPCRSQRWRIHVGRHNASIIDTQHGYFSRLSSKSSLKYVIFFKMLIKGWNVIMTLILLSYLFVYLYSLRLQEQRAFITFL